MLGRLMVHVYLWLYYLLIVVFNLIGIGLALYLLPKILYFIITGGFGFAQ